jgi:hypothetical protein
MPNFQSQERIRPEAVRSLKHDAGNAELENRFGHGFARMKHGSDKKNSLLSSEFDPCFLCGQFFFEF